MPKFKAGDYVVVFLNKKIVVRIKATFTSEEPYYVIEGDNISHAYWSKSWVDKTGIKVRDTEWTRKRYGI